MSSLQFKLFLAKHAIQFFLCQARNFNFSFPSYDEDGNELPALEVEDPYKNDYQQVRERGVVQVL